MTAPRHRLTPVERLARDIAWVGGADPREFGCTKAAHWAGLPDLVRRHYLDEAHRFTWLVRKLGAPTIAKILAET